MKCQAKHTPFQPTDEQWQCPKCGAGFGDFTIDESASDIEDCSKLHSLDCCHCHSCGYETSGSIVARRLKKELNMQTCPTCKGVGCVPKSD
jgi:hypothetical protein